MNAETGGESPGALRSRILLVEDNAIVALNAEELLLEIGAKEVIVATSVAEAEACCDTHEFDFALLDLNLGDGNSIGIADRLHRAKVPFAFASGQENCTLPLMLSDYPVLKKPYLLVDLERIVRAALPPA
jgi:CheY-like chemotaxis protein